MKTLNIKLAAIALSAAFSVPAFADYEQAQAAVKQFNKDVETCVAQIDPSKSATIQKAEEFECDASATYKRDIAIHGPIVKATVKSPITKATVDNLFSTYSQRAAVVVNGEVKLKSDEFPGGLDIVALADEAKKSGFATKAWSVVKPGLEKGFFAHESGFFAMAASEGDTVLVSVVADGGSAMSAKKYRVAAVEEAKVAAVKAANTAAKEAAKASGK